MSLSDYWAPALLLYYRNEGNSLVCWPPPHPNTFLLILVNIGVFNSQSEMQARAELSGGVEQLKGDTPSPPLHYSPPPLNPYFPKGGLAQQDSITELSKCHRRSQQKATVALWHPSNAPLYPPTPPHPISYTWVHPLTRVCMNIYHKLVVWAQITDPTLHTSEPERGNSIKVQ